MKKLLITVCLILITSPAIAGTWGDVFATQGDWQVIGDNVNSKWIIKNGELFGQWEPVFKSHYVTHVDAPWKDYTVSCKVKFSKLHDPLKFDGAHVSLGVRQQWNESHGRLNGVFFTVNIKARTASFLNLYDGNIFDTTGEKVPLQWFKWYQLRVVVEGNGVKGYIDDVLIDDGSALKRNQINIAPTGGVSLGIFCVYAVFDDVMIKGEDIPTNKWAIMPRGKLANTWGRLKAGDSR